MKPRFDAIVAKEYFSALLGTYKGLADKIHQRDNQDLAPELQYASAAHQQMVGRQQAIQEVLKYFDKYDLSPLPVDPYDDDFQSVLICAERYACGRRSYMPDVVIRVIRPLIGLMSDRTLSAMRRDLTEAQRLNGLGDPMIDAPGWIQLLQQVEDEISRRANNGGEVNAK